LENCRRSRCQRGSIGLKAEDYDAFLFLYLALLHYSITPTTPGSEGTLLAPSRGLQTKPRPLGVHSLLHHCRNLINIPHCFLMAPATHLWCNRLYIMPEVFIEPAFFSRLLGLHNVSKTSIIAGEGKR